MNRLLILSLCLTVASAEVFRQAQGTSTNSPKEVGAAFWKLETEGGRLSPEGWRKAQDFFVRLGAAPQKKNVAVISAKVKCATDERNVKENRTEIVNQCIDLGRIDDRLRYSDPGYDRYDKINVVHILVLTDKHWEVGASGTEKEVIGPLTWRIENPEPVIWITVHAALQYVTKARQETAEPELRKNADRTLAALAKLR